MVTRLQNRGICADTAIAYILYLTRSAYPPRYGLLILVFMNWLQKLRLANRIILLGRNNNAASYPALALRFLRAHLAQFSPTEIAQLDLMNTGQGGLSIDNCISKETFLSLQARLNPPSLTDDTENKLRFHARCVANDIPVPRLLGEFHYHPEGNAGLAGVPETPRSDIADIISGAGGKDCVIKPANGYNGLGVIVLHTNRPVTDSDSKLQYVFSHLKMHPKFSHWLVQERLENHALLQALNPAQALQTVRIVTCVERDKKVRVIAAQWRVASTDAPIDSFAYGTNKNLLCNLYPDTGKIEVCYRGKNFPLEFGLETHNDHPETGEALVGRHLPNWQALLDLSRRAANAFMPSRCIGWDMAITNDGPVLIEGNRYWDPHNEDGRMGDRLRYLLKQVSTQAL